MTQFTNFIFATGDKDAIPLEIAARRYAVVKPHLIIVGQRAHKFKSIQEGREWVGIYGPGARRKAHLVRNSRKQAAMSIVHVIRRPKP